MRIAFISSEAVPWCKTGGLADVAGSLPHALQEIGGADLQSALFIPLYRQVRAFVAAQQQKLIDTGVEVHIPFGVHKETARFLTCSHPQRANSSVPVYFLDAPRRYDREGLYNDAANRAYEDNAYRYALLCRAVLEAAPRLMAGTPHIIHAHDWQGSLASAYLRTRYRHVMPHTRSVLTIHNLAYQGIVPSHHRHTLDLDEALFNVENLEYHGHLNLLKGGIACSDRTTTVSPSYAREILTPEFGCNLDGFLRTRAAQVDGIINGIDVNDWNPATDSALTATYTHKSLTGKALCRQDLLRRFQLHAEPGEPVIGVVSRLVNQKGLDLIAELVPLLYHFGARLVLLGNGDQELEKRFRWLSQTFSHHFSAKIGFDEPLSRKIFAGADILLMPSRFEPCGLNQLYAMRYGTIPVVHAVGGLRDTVIDPGDEALARGEGTGFSFEHPTLHGLCWALHRAVEMYRHRSHAWHNLMIAAMYYDSSWQASAKAYLRLYQMLV